jgi:group II intron reverse transcriptase/maturase
MRPLGLPSWSDKLVGEVVRLLLEAYYEPAFSVNSHGFRPGRGCHTALTDVAVGWSGTTWFIEGDIADCFGWLDHEVMVRILSEKIHDNRFLRLIRNMLKVGYLEDWKYHETLSGCPQGGVVSPVLSNIYLSKLDAFAETVIIPQYTRGERRKGNPEYRKAHYRLTQARRKGNRAEAREYQRQVRSLPFGDPDDPGYRRLRYSRYADDHLLGFTGPKAEAEDIKNQLARFLRDELKLELSREKTLVTHARTRAARYLGYEITVQHADRKITGGRRSANGTIALRVPLDVIRAKRALYRRHGKPGRRTALLNLDDYDIVRIYGAEYRGIVGYYLLASDVWRLGALRWNAETSMLETLAAKHRSSVSKTAARYKAVMRAPPRSRLLTGPSGRVPGLLRRAGRRASSSWWPAAPLSRWLRRTPRTTRRRGRGSGTAPWPPARGPAARSCPRWPARCARWRGGGRTWTPGFRCARRAGGAWQGRCPR